MAGTQILALRVGGRGGGGFRCCFADGLNQSLVSSAAQASAFQSNYILTVLGFERERIARQKLLSWYSLSSNTLASVFVCVCGHSRVHENR